MNRAVKVLPNEIICQVDLRDNLNNAGNATSHEDRRMMTKYLQ